MQDNNRIILKVNPESKVDVNQGTFKIFRIPEVCQSKHRETENPDDKGQPCSEYESGNIYCGHTLNKHGRWMKKRIERYNDYKAAIASAARKAGFEIPYHGGWSLYFFIPMPKRWSIEDRIAMHGQPHHRKFDLDNGMKAIFDSLTLNDEKISQLSGCGKFWVDTKKGPKRTDPIGPGWIEILINQPIYNPFSVTFIDQSIVKSLQSHSDYKKRQQAGKTRKYEKNKPNRRKPKHNKLFKREDKIK